jgi:hypothetical protein
MATKNDSFIHVKLEYEEVIKSKKDILASEADILNIIKSMSRYTALRSSELDLKAQFYKEIKKIVIGIKMLETTLPHVKVPKILGPSEEKPVERKIAAGKNETGLEEQLREIQRRLRAISS